MATQSVPNQFPVLVTAATQAQLHDPAFAKAVAAWHGRVQRVRVLVPERAVTKEYRGITYIRAKADTLYLAEVVRQAVLALDHQHSSVVVCDPLVGFSAPLVAMLHPQFLGSRNLGNAWMATAQAIQLDESGEGGPLEESLLRWFAGAANAWKVLQDDLPANIPFVQPVWSGWLATWCQRRISRHRYHDVTAQHAVVSWMPEVGAVDTAGYGPLTFNPPTLAYREMTQEPEAASV